MQTSRNLLAGWGLLRPAKNAGLAMTNLILEKAKIINQEN
jgi:hypothetical protein